MKTDIKAQFLITPFYSFFLIHTMQIGVGILSFQRNIAQHAGHDAWMVVILTGVIGHILIVMMYSMLNREKKV